MGEPTVKLVADIPPHIKEKLKKIAQKREVSIKDILVEMIESIPESKEEELKNKKVIKQKES